MRPLSEIRRAGWGRLLFLGALLLCPTAHGAAPPVVVQLRNGDRITGKLIAQETNHVVVDTGWAGTLSLPLSAIGGLHTTSGDNLIPAEAPAKAPPASKATVAANAKGTKPTAPASQIKLNVQLGSNLAFGARDQQLVYSRVKATYLRPYEHDPKKFFRSLADFSADYGQTEKVRSANRVNGSLKTDFDDGQKTYFYNVFGGGYDEIRKIDQQYAAGPGVGYHLLKLTKFEMDVETGLDYQAQYRSTGTELSSTYWRLGDDITWKIGPRLSWSKKIEYFLNTEDVAQFRFRLDSTLSYKLVENVSLNLSLLDTFDTNPAPQVNRNELQIRSAVGMTF